MILYSQRDPRWSNHPLGWGPALGTIGEYGCLDTVFAMIANDSGHPIDPAGLDETFTSGQVFQRESTGAFDLLPDDALPRVYPADYRADHYWGWRGDLVAMAVPTPNIYAVLWISTSAVPTHFVLAYSANGTLIADPWTGRVGALAGYGGPASVHKTILVTRLEPPPTQPVNTQPPPAALPQPTAPAEPVPVPSPPPMALYAFIPVPASDLHPADQVTTLGDAMEQANEYVATQPVGTVLIVRDANGDQIYQAGGTSLEA